MNEKTIRYPLLDKRNKDNIIPHYKISCVKYDNTEIICRDILNETLAKVTSNLSKDYVERGMSRCRELIDYLHDEYEKLEQLVEEKIASETELFNQLTIAYNEVSHYKKLVSSRTSNILAIEGLKKSLSEYDDPILEITEDFSVTEEPIEISISYKDRQFFNNNSPITVTSLMKLFPLLKRSTVTDNMKKTPSNVKALFDKIYPDNTIIFQ